MSSEPTVPVAPVIKIMSSGPLLEIGFWVSCEWAQLPRDGPRPAMMRVSQLAKLVSFHYYYSHASVPMANSGRYATAVRQVAHAERSARRRRAHAAAAGSAALA